LRVQSINASDVDLGEIGLIGNAILLGVGELFAIRGPSRRCRCTLGGLWRSATRTVDSHRGLGAIMRHEVDVAGRVVGDCSSGALVRKATVLPSGEIS